MVSKKTLWYRIRGSIKVTAFAMFIYTIFTFLNPIFTSDLNTEQQPKPKVQIEKISPLEGHWLKTKENNLPKEDQNSLLASEPQEHQKDLESPRKKFEELPNAEPRPSQKSLEEVEIPYNNKKLNNTDVIFYWTEGSKLKAVTIMSLNEESKRGGVVALPLYTKVEKAGSVTTLAEVFLAEGREAVTKLLEDRMEIKVESYVDIDQKTFEKLSEMLGPVDISGEVITVTEAFEQTRSGIRKDDTAVVRAVASRIIRPDMLVKIPKIVWVLSREIDTNLGPSEIMSVYKITQNTDVNTMTKVALQGENYVKDGKRYRDVPEHIWKNILWELTK